MSVDQDTTPVPVNQPIANTIRESLLAGLALLVLLLIFFWPAVFTGRVLLPADIAYELDPLWWSLAPEGFSHSANHALGDQLYQFLPWAAYARRSLAQGRLPIWNPYISGGHPFLGNGLSGVLSPFNLVGYMVPLYSSFVVTAVLRLWIAGMFTFLFAREVGLSRAGSSLAAVTFAFSGPLVAWVSYPPAHVIVWLPACLLMIERTLTRQSWLYALAAGISMGLQFLSGQPESSFHLALVSVAYTAYRLRALLSKSNGHRSRLFGQIGLAALVGLLLSAVQLLPFADSALQSAVLASRQDERAVALTALLKDIFFEWQEWPAVITTLLPLYFGTPIDNSYWLPYGNYIEQHAYAGVLPLALATMVALRFLRQRSPSPSTHTAFLLFLAFISLGVATSWPVLNVVNKLPLFNVAVNGRLRLVYVFAVALLAGIGLDEVVSRPSTWSSGVLKVLTALAIVSLLLTILAYGGFFVFRDRVIQSGRTFMEMNHGSPYFARPLDDYYTMVEDRYAKKLSLYSPANVTMYLPLLVALGWTALSQWRLRLSEAAWASVALGLSVVDLFLVGMPFNPTVPRQQVLPTPDAIEFLQRELGLGRVVATEAIMNPNLGMLYDIQDVRGYDAVVLQRYKALIDQLQGHYRIHHHSLFVGVESPLLDLLNVKYAITDRELGAPWQLAYAGSDPVQVYRNPNALARAFVVYRAAVVATPKQSLARITQSGFPFREQVVLEERPANWHEPPHKPVTAPSTQILAYEPDHVAIEVSTAVDGLLVLTDAFARGWHAKLDGEVAPIYVADHAFRAVVVPAGSHRVEFKYRPLSFVVGATLSLATLAATALGGLLSWLFRRTGYAV